MSDEEPDQEAVRGATGKRVEPAESANVMAMEKWDMVVADMEATAAEYDEQGWETLQLHPGDITPEPGEGEADPGLDLVLPDDEYEQLAEHVEAGFGVDEIEVLRADGEAMTYLVFTLQDRDRGQAVLAPAYYRQAGEEAETMFRQAREEGALQLYLRRLTGECVTVTVGDLELVEPPAE